MSTDQTAVRPFRIDIPQTQIDDLHARLDHTRWPHQLPDVGWTRGVPTDHVRELADYWRHSFDWRRQEELLNARPQFVTEIDGLRVHFEHIRSPEPDALPLVLVHGWPGSPVEFAGVIDALTDPRAHGGDPADAFHVVVPTLPGFGFSGPTEVTGQAATERAAALIAALMDRLGYERYGTQGGDAGSFVGPQLGRLHPGRVVGVHVNGLLTIPSWDVDTSGYSEADRAKVAQLSEWGSDTGGYAAIQSTRPQALAYGLTDSPVGLLGWLADIFHLFTDPAVDAVHEAVDQDAFLTNVSIYWFTGTIGSSMRLYTEGEQWGATPASSGVPTACANFPGDVTVRALADEQNNVVRWTDFDRGGHFAAMEAPDLLVADVREFFADLRR
ncbi:epoxide hydrolase 1 [Rhodococcus triatomae]|uniref:Pimeloyl-ACP methyl ester carboxylesterase n=1 Tax=Rhodococcus triatomae TaxID=300028 RepID=A0A1G8HPW7_9NOCA|nr:epoxide hydrolase family protein [Rhodococcus triatomae]QNG20847.1 epoxide hydrolase 1 [Rhodococcus triatomae]QNG23238.1 epoxide hydrolase 1 [Rhodococcus triatomae]SDI08707.1 Pimeloyl-ACP methyl ester carboxylesterase [Rhodococcus triatomae]